MKENTRKDTKSWTTILMTIIILMLFITMTSILIFRKANKPEEPPATSELVYDESAVEGGWEQLSQEEIEGRLNNQLEEGMINISMNTSPYFEDGGSKGNLMIVARFVPC